MRFPFVFGLMLFAQFSKAQSKTIAFKPTTFYRNFSHKIRPVLHFSPGDTIVTESVDAGGFDKTGTQVGERGNPQTGPFFVEDAMPRF